MRRRIALLVAGCALTGHVLAAPAGADAAGKRERARVNAKGGRGDRTMVVTLRTIPRVAGLEVTQGGQTRLTGRDGRVRLRVRRLPGGERTAEGFGFETPRIHDKTLRPGVVARFGRFGFGGSATRINVGLALYYRVTTAFTDADGRPISPTRVQRIALKSHVGTETVGSGVDSLMLQGSRVGPYGRHGALATKSIGYSVRAVIVDGSNVVNRGEIRFYPFRTRRLEIPLLFFDVVIRSRDALFDRRAGDRISIVGPDGREVVRRLDADGVIQLRRMPRGEYRVRSNAAGLGTSRLITLSRPQSVEVRVVSTVDLALLGSGGAGLAVGLVLLRRPHLRRRLRRAVRRRPAPSPSPSLSSRGSLDA